MNIKINTICFIFLLFLLVGVASAADMDNETLTQTIEQPEDDLCQKTPDNQDQVMASPENTKKLDAGVNKEKLESSNDQSKKSTSYIITAGSKLKVNINAPDVKMHYKDGSKFKVTVKDELNKAIKKAKVKIKIDGKTYTKTTDSRGKASISLNLKSGKYTVVTTFDETKDYYKKSIKSTVKIKSTIKAKDFSKYYKNKSTYSSTFYDKKGKLLKKSSVKFKLNGKTHSVKTNKKGVARLAVDLNPGTYGISSINSKTSETITKKITIISILETKDLTMNENDGSKFTVKVLNSYGKISPNKKVTLNVNGQTYTPKSNSEGIAAHTIDLPAGKYIITTEYEGLKNTNHITVNKVIAENQIRKSGFSHITMIPNYVNVTTPYVFQNSAYSLKTGEDGIIKMPKNEVFTVRVCETKDYTFTQSEISGVDSIIIGYKTHLVPFDGSGVKSDYDKDNLKGDGILISKNESYTQIEYRSTTEENTELFGIYMDRGLENSETITYLQNYDIMAMVNIYTYNFDETGVKYSLGKYYGKSVYDFAYQSYDEITGHNANTIRFANTGQPVTFTYFGKSIATNMSKEDITTKMIVNGKEELEKPETITYGLGGKYRKTLGFEVLQGYAIINEKVTRNVLERWVDLNAGYLIRFGVMNVYGMFLASLETAWIADEMADKYADDFNVKWSREKTTTILGGINLDDTYINVLNADMGMGISGNDKNIGLFRLINSLYLPNIEEYVLGPVSERFWDNATNSLNNVLSQDNFSMLQLGDSIYVFNNNDSAIILNTTSGVCNVVLSHDNSIYKGSQIPTAGDCCSVSTTPKDIISSIRDLLKASSPAYALSDHFKKIHPLTTMAYNVGKYILGSSLTGVTALAHTLVSTMVFIQATGTTYRDRMIEEKDWHDVMDKVTFTRPGYLQSKKIYNIPNKNGGTDYIEVKINDDLSLDRTTVKYISQGSTKQLSKEETYKYFSEDYWTPFSMPSKYWDESWKSK
jgi:hypothetical protein